MAKQLTHTEARKVAWQALRDSGLRFSGIHVYLRKRDGDNVVDGRRIFFTGVAGEDTQTQIKGANRALVDQGLFLRQVPPEFPTDLPSYELVLARNVPNAT